MSNPDLSIQQRREKVLPYAARDTWFAVKAASGEERQGLAICDGEGPAETVVDMRIGGNAERIVDRRVQFGGFAGLVDRLRGDLVGLSVDLSALDSTAGKGH